MKEGRRGGKEEGEEGGSGDLGRTELVQKVLGKEAEGGRGELGKSELEKELDLIGGGPSCL